MVAATFRRHLIGTKSLIADLGRDIFLPNNQQITLCYLTFKLSVSQSVPESFECTQKINKRRIRKKSKIKVFHIIFFVSALVTFIKSSFENNNGKYLENFCGEENFYLICRNYFL